MKSSRWLLAPTAALLVLLTSCGGHSTASAPPAPSYSTAALVGSWRLFGGNNSSTGSALSISMGVVGAQIHGRAANSLACSNGVSEGGFDMAMDGEIAADGSFEMKNAAADDVLFTIKGNAPFSGATSWSGSYTLSSHAGSICTIQQSGNFNATQLPSVTGTYSGSVTGFASGQTTSVTISTTLTQGSFTSNSIIPETPYYYTPVTANVTAVGASCFTSAAIGDTVPVLPPEQVMGNVVQLNLATDTGGMLSVQGYFTDDTEKTMEFQGSVLGDKCAQRFDGTLTRQ